jgi:hypothetical protein
MGAAARRFVRDHHAWDAMLAPLGALLGGAAGRAAGRVGEGQRHAA